MAARLILAAAMAAGVYVLAACSDAGGPGSSCDESGAAATVTARASTFDPTSVTIDAGEQVCWENDGAAVHTVTSDAQGQFAQSLPTSSLYIRTFETAGSFPYHCELHQGMVGTVIVE